MLIFPASLVHDNRQRANFCRGSTLRVSVLIEVSTWLMTGLQTCSHGSSPVPELLVSWKKSLGGGKGQTSTRCTMDVLIVFVTLLDSDYLSKTRDIVG